MGDEIAFGFRPRRRLRHLKGVRLVDAQFGGEEKEVFFEIESLAAPSGTAVVYTSEKVPASLPLNWAPIEFDTASVAPPLLHSYQSGRVSVRAFATGSSPTQPDKKKIVELSIDLNHLVPWVPDGGCPGGLIFDLTDGLYCLGDGFSVPAVNSEIDADGIGGEGPSVIDVEEANSAETSRGREGGLRAFIQNRIWRHVPSFSNLSETSRTSLESEVRPSSLPSPSSPGPSSELLPEDSLLGTKPYNLPERRTDIRGLAVAHKALCEVTERHRKLRKYVSEILEGKARQHEQLQKLRVLKQKTEEYLARVSAAESRLETLKSSQEKESRFLCARSEVMTEASSALKAACQRWEEAENVLAGDQGVGRLKDIQSQLVSRRCVLVTGLSDVYALGPRSIADPLLRAQRLEDSLDRRWYTGTDNLVSQTREPNWILGDGHPYRGLLSVMGLDLPPRLVKHVHDGLLGWSSDPELCQRTSAALGYVAHITHMCASYLDVPLRYPIRSRGSKSVIYSYSLSSSKPDSAQGGSWLSHRSRWQRSKKTNSDTYIEEFPLYYQSTDRSKFAYGIYLLDKDIQQLLAAHGVKPNGPSFVLQNLYNLVAAAYSGLSTPSLKQ